MDPVGSSSPSEKSEPTPTRGQIADMCRDVSSSSQLASSSAGLTSPTESIRRLPVLDGPGLCDMRDMDSEACEPRNYRHHEVVGVEPPSMENLQDSSEIWAQWAQLIPDEAFEQCFQLDDLDSLLESCSGVMDFPNHEPQFVYSSDSGSPENSETLSPSSVSVGDRESNRDDQTMVTTSSGSVGTSTRRSPAKRKCRERNTEAAGGDCDGAEPGTSRPKHAM